MAMMEEAKAMGDGGDRDKDGGDKMAAAWQWCCLVEAAAWSSPLQELAAGLEKEDVWGGLHGGGNCCLVTAVVGSSPLQLLAADVSKRPSWSSGVVLVTRGGNGAAVLVSLETTTKVLALRRRLRADGAEVMMEGAAVDSRDGVMAGTSPGTVADEVTDETEGDEMTEGMGVDETKVGVADEAERAEVAGGAKTLVGKAEAKAAGTDEVAMMADAGDAGTAEAGGAGELKMVVVNEVTGTVDEVGTAGAMGVGDMKAMTGDAGTMVGAGVGMG
ncbi:hypothetical protein F5148DRAFT_1151252 [Russula earlei]|uniref:Uncharacterized protein n=1 Tax=Russula earlei TaxID=71964 RepID=A0ACC0U2I3_9AGAM|nr:hypothetical protein F5148DRAFT_1151252 [Russula earlei]